MNDLLGDFSVWGVSKLQCFWGVTPCSVVDWYRRLEGTVACILGCQKWARAEDRYVVMMVGADQAVTLVGM